MKVKRFLLLFLCAVMLFENGILQIALPKQEQKQLPSTTAIAIE